MARQTNFFKPELTEEQKAFEASLAAFVDTIEVVDRPEYVPTAEDLKQPKSIKIRKSMSVADWDDCLK